MSRLLRQELDQEITIPTAVWRPGLHGLAGAGGCSLGEVSKKRDFFGESLSGVCLPSGNQAGINRLIRLLIPTDMDMMDLMERQAIVCFGFSSAIDKNQFENKHKQSNLNANGGLFGHPPMEVLS